LMAGWSFQSAGCELLRTGKACKSTWHRLEFICDRTNCAFKSSKSIKRKHLAKDGLDCMGPDHWTCLVCNTAIGNVEFLEHRQTCGWNDIDISTNDKGALDRHYFKVFMRLGLKCLKTLYRKWNRHGPPQKSDKLSRSTCYNISLSLLSNCS
jgi:hypothetical protein